MKNILLLSGLLICVSHLFATAEREPIRGKVLHVIDGNTVEFISIESEIFRLVLSGIDCPELDQNFGDDARRMLEELTQGKEMLAMLEGKDRFGNHIGNLLFTNGYDPRVDMLEKGLAWTAEKNPNPEFEIIKEQARIEKKGLWSQEKPISPWTFRRQQSMLVAKSG